MSSIRKYFFSLFLCTLFSVSLAFGQPAVRNSDGQSNNQSFISVIGRFKIDLPKQPHGFLSAVFNTPNGELKGSKFPWRMPDGWFEISYADANSKITLPSNTKFIFDKIRQQIIEDEGHGELKSEINISLDKNPGIEIKFTRPESLTIVRLYRVENRLYLITAKVFQNAETKESNEERVTRFSKILNSFKLITPKDITDDIERRIADATPSPLPQEPVAQKLKSDAEDHGLKGKVKIVLVESEDLSGTLSVQGRKPSSTSYYNEQGNITKRVLFDYRGNPFDLTVYGYLDGDRVSSSKTIRYEYDPPPMGVIAVPGQPQPAYDPRFDYKYKYRYDDKGRLAEMWMYMSNGELGLRYVYNLKDNQRERLVYSADGKLNQKYVETLDNKRNMIEETIFEVKDDSVRNKYLYTYEFDKQGNWIKKTASKQVIKDGKPFFEPSFLHHRTITYY